MATSAHEFKRTTELLLPSGNTVEVRKPNIKRLVLHSPKGQVPEFLTQIVLSGLNGKPAENPLEHLNELSDDEKLKALAGLDDFNELVVRSTVINPRIAEGEPNYDAGEIAYDDLSDEDTAFIAAWGMPKDAQAATTFPAGQTGGLETTSDLSIVRSETE